jgi:SAM-dependent methyltransferase
VTVPLYDNFSDYDRFVNWERRLSYELPFVEGQLAAVDAQSVLDVACGTGAHAIALARRGYDVSGADLSAGMIGRARQSAMAAGADAPLQGGVRFVVAGFGELAAQLGAGFDALLCLGNSLPHVLTPGDLAGTLDDFAACLRPGGLLLVQNRNFDAVVADRARWMVPQSSREGNHEWLFLRFYDFNADGTLTFQVVTLERDGLGAWQQRVDATPLYPWQHAELVEAIRDAGFGDIRCYGDMAGASFDRSVSGNLVITARRTGEEGRADSW